MDDFKLSATLSGHDDDVRAVVFPGPNIVISASRDGTVRVWKIINSPPPTFDATISSHGSAFVNTAAYLSPTKNYPQGLIISGGKDTVIEVREPSKSPEDNAEALLLGHTSNVCALDVDADGEFIVSGSWDGKARLWSVEKWDCVAIMEEHEASVWAVLAYNSKTVITGSADKFIRIYNTSGRLLRSIPGGGDVIRALCKVPKNHPSGADFASASNDGIIRLWTIDGRQVGELIGHESFIYSLAYLATGELVSSGEDRTVRVWKGTNCIQTITLPAISVWGVAVCSQNGDIAAGASDRLIRVFSRDPDRYADAESIRLFEESVKASSIPQQSVGEINKEKLPGPEFLTQKSGTKEGQVQMINEPNGSITAHQWSASQQEWINIGTVVDAVGSSGKKVEFGGKSYDFVFDVDIEDGKPALKLPYNLSDNPYEAATKFIEKNKLPISYLDQVANFITTNTQGSTLGSSSNPGPAPVGSDPWGSEARYRPGGDTSSAPPRSAAPKILPQQTYLSIVHASYDAMQKKIEQLNQKFIKDGQKDISLNPAELATLSSLRKHLETTGATATSQAVAGGLDLTVKLVTAWPYGDRMPGLDLLRLLAIAPKTATFSHPRVGNIVDILEGSVCETTPPAENHVMMAVRAFVNLFESEEGRKLALADFDKINSLTSQAILRGTSNRNLLIAAVTLYINYAVMLQSSPETFEQGLALLEVLSKILSSQTDSEVVYRALIATGTLLGLNEELKTAAKEVYGIEGAISTAVSKAADPRVKNVAAEVRALLI